MHVDLVNPRGKKEDEDNNSNDVVNREEIDEDKDNDIIEEEEVVGQLIEKDNTEAVGDVEDNRKKTRLIAKRIVLNVEMNLKHQMIF